jgi:TM2 domain-containing membrane protein YozV
MSTAYAAPVNPAASASNPYQQAATPIHNSPALAFVLGMIPGVGAIYNGQYVKGLIHAVISGLLVSLITATEESAGEPFIAMVLVTFWFYMAFEAFHTAKKRQAGVPVDEWSSLITPNRYMSRAPIGPVLLILLGVLFLLDTLHLIAFRELARFWPVLLIVAGSVMLYYRIANARTASQVLDQPIHPTPMESSHE